jgi:hypothetical protein
MVIGWLEELGQLKIPMTSLEIKAATFRLVAKCLNQLRYCVVLLSIEFYDIRPLPLVGLQTDHEDKAVAMSKHLSRRSVRKSLFIFNISVKLGLKKDVQWIDHPYISFRLFRFFLQRPTSLLALWTV